MLVSSIFVTVSLGNVLLQMISFQTGFYPHSCCCPLKLLLFLRLNKSVGSPPPTTVQYQDLSLVGSNRGLVNPVVLITSFNGDFICIYSL